MRIFLSDDRWVIIVFVDLAADHDEQQNMTILQLLFFSSKRLKNRLGDRVEHWPVIHPYKVGLCQF